MESKQHFCNSLFRIISRAATAALAIAFVLVLTVVLTQSAQAQTLTVLYTFTGGADGANPYAGLTMDQAGNLYGTAQAGGSHGNGTVFKLTKKNSNWIMNPLYSFQGGNDGANPTARVIFGPDGSLYGTTTYGGGGPCSYGPYTGCGTVFKLQPSPVACRTALCPWTETVLYRFTGGSDGANPQGGDLLVDQPGNLYGTTLGGGAYGLGAVFSLSPSKGVWTESVLHSFTGYEGANPYSSVISDNAGNLYGTANSGGTFGYGTVYELIPSGSVWQVKTLYAFSSTKDDGYAAYPVGGLIFDGSGNLYGTTVANSFEIGGGGTVFELTLSDGNWTMTKHVNLGGDMTSVGPVASLVMDAGGNLYGIQLSDRGVEVAGEIFNWGEDLYNFWRPPYGGYPQGQLILDASGNLYSTTEFNDGEEDGYGVIFELTP